MLGDWFSIHYPTRTSDGEPFIPQMLDLRQLRITEARAAAADSLRRARAARVAGDSRTWGACMASAAQSRELFGGLKRSGGRVDWRGQPYHEQQEQFNE